MPHDSFAQNKILKAQLWRRVNRVLGILRLSEIESCVPYMLDLLLPLCKAHRFFFL